MAFDVTWEERAEGMIVVRPSGHLDSDTYTIFENALVPLLGQATRVMVFDMEALDYISSAGLRVLFKAVKALEAQGSSYLLSNLKPQIRKVFEIINALPDMRIFKDIQEVDAYLDVIQQREMARAKGEPLPEDP